MGLAQEGDPGCHFPAVHFPIAAPPPGSRWKLNEKEGLGRLTSG